MTTKPVRKAPVRGNRWFDMVIARLVDLDVWEYVSEAHGVPWLTDQMVSLTWADTTTAADIIAQRANAY